MTIRESVNSSLPVVVAGHEINDPMVTVFGENVSWALAIACPWTLTGRDFEHRWDEGNLVEAMDRLLGASLIRVEIDENLIDPVFHFSNDLQLSVHADTDLDPWVLRLPGMDLVLVGLAH